ncbi:MAG: nucleotidyl transferase AbiEii/AbiGii toxin family protein [Gemmatimonadota bacterium]
MGLLLSPVAAREVVHLLILQELSGVRGGDVVTVKGGVNLRLFFQSVRYSEDIDLDGIPDASSAIRGCIKGIFRDRALLLRLRRMGIRGLDPGEGPNKDTETTFRYKFGVLVGGVRHPTKVEVSYRDPYPGDRAVLEATDARLVSRYGMEPIPARRYVREAAIRQKIDALGGRNQVQARDVFDLHALGAGAADVDLLSFLAGGLGRSRLEESYKRALEITYGEYEGQVLEFLEADARARYGSESAWDEIRLEAADLIERVMKHGEEAE